MNKHIAKPAQDTPRSAILKVLAFWGIYLLGVVGVALVRNVLPGLWGAFAWGVLSSVALLIATRLFLRRDGFATQGLGFRFNRASLVYGAAGLVVGVAQYAASALTVSALCGPVRFVAASTPGVDLLLPVLGMICALVVMEELGFRGYPLRTLAPVIGPWPALVLVTAAFGLLHLAYGWSWQNVLMGVVPSSILFGLAALASRGLAMPIGLHAGANIAHWAAGETDTPGLWHIETDAPNLANLETWAPSISLVVACLFILAFWLWYRRSIPVNAQALSSGAARPNAMTLPK